nr:ParB N-terminal domain-containing protein [Micromonospora sp. DSM 115978]
MRHAQKQNGSQEGVAPRRPHRPLTAVTTGPGRRPDPIRVPLTQLKGADSPRLRGVDQEHVRLLAGLDGPLPAILVHRNSMRVVDGMHRLAAAELRGQDTVEVRFFEGTREQAFVRSVQANVGHGLPLSLKDRSAAARRIIRSFGSWSDRAIADVTGLAPGTVAAIRRSLTDVEPPTSRVGRDGKVRPVNSDEGRRIAGAIIRDHPEASLREVARRAGISPTTVRDVRERIERGEHPTLRGGPRTGTVVGRIAGPDAAVDIDALVQGLRNDPSLRFTDVGRTFLRWLGPRVVDAQEWSRMAGSIPPHCAYPVAALARRCSQEWLAFAEMLEQAEVVERHERRSA